MPTCRAVLCILLFPILAHAASFANGADIGWLSEMEASGEKFYDSTGMQKDLLDILSSTGINSIRLRVWVNPPSRYCNKSDVVKMAARAHRKGFRIMIDFHYSDGWAAPDSQTIPAAWAGYTTAQLVQAVATHTTDVLTALSDSGVTPEWVQVGNETNNGMLWENGKASTYPADFAAMVSSGAAAVKAVFPNALVVVHISNGYDNDLFRWMFDLLKANNATWDAIGMSLYPSITNWRTYNTQCLANMKDMVSRYGSKVLISEVGMSWDQPDSSYAMLTQLLANAKSVTDALGVFYWEPEAYNGWQNYGLGAFDNAGKPTKAMNAFLPEAPTAIAAPMTSFVSDDPTWRMSPSGVQLHSTEELEWRILDLSGREVDHGHSHGDHLVAAKLSHGTWILALRTPHGTTSLVFPKL